MIIVRLIGGLGNQLFQYAIGRALSIKRNTELMLDISGFNYYKLRDYGLSNFNINAKIAKQSEINRLRKPRLNIIIGKINGILGYEKFKIKTLYKEKIFSYDHDVLMCSDNTYLDGYWQSERYFSDIRDILLNEISVVAEPDEPNKRIIKNMRAQNSISVHIRRGDYVTDKVTNSVYNHCSLEYYDKAISIMKKKLNDPVFYVFSDDIEWVKYNFSNYKNVIFIDHNDKDVEDLRLMSNCKHNIIANSTFSWWAAWLNTNPSKFVICPKRWFNSELINTNDLIKSDWIKVDN